MIRGFWYVQVLRNMPAALLALAPPPDPNWSPERESEEDDAIMAAAFSTQSRAEAAAKVAARKAAREAAANAGRSIGMREGDVIVKLDGAAVVSLRFLNKILR